MSLDAEITKLIGSPDMAEAESLMRRYPYFQFPAMMMFKYGASALSDDDRRRLSARVALTAPDPETLRMLADPDSEQEYIGFYPDEHTVTTPTTDAAIDKFIDTYGKPDQAEEDLLTRLIFNPVPDYAQILAREEEKSAPLPGEAPAGTQDSLINDFIIKSRANHGHFPAPDSGDGIQAEEQAAVPQQQAIPQQTTDDSLLSESLAKIYIRQRRYAKAYEIISNLNLNFPEKSIYFADQLRFLQKLMLAEKHRTDKN